MYDIQNGNLPTALRDYASGVADFPDGHFSEREVLAARQLRKAFFRKLQRYLPGKQWQWPDYYSLMGGEIKTYSDRALKARILGEWDVFCDTYPRLNEIFQARLDNRLRRHHILSLTKRNRMATDVAREIFWENISDPRTLGAMEQFVFGYTFYGVPT